MSCAAHDQPCLLSLSVGCCYGYEKLVEPNELSQQRWEDQPFYLWKAVWHRASRWKKHFYFKKKKNLLKEESHNGHASAQSLQPRVPASCPCDKLLTAVAISWLENGECRVIMLRISSRAAAGKGFVSGRQAFPAQLSQQLPSWENRGSEKRVTPSASTGPVRGCCLQVWESRCVLGWALGWNAGSRSRVHLLPVNRLLAPSICSRTLKLRLRKGLQASHLTDGGKLFSSFESSA